MAEQEEAGGLAEAAGGGGGEGGGGGKSGRRKPWAWRTRPGLPADQSPADQIAPKRTYFYVKGYPKNTSVEDVINAFSEFLPVKLSQRHAWGMMLYTEDAAAFRELPHMYVNGQRVRVLNRGWDGKQGKREFPKSKKSSVIIEPTTIDLGGSFCAQMSCVLNSVRLPQERVELLHLLYVHVEEALGTIWPECSTVAFGSITAGLGMRNSDADCFVYVPEKFYRTDVQVVNKAERILRKYPQYFTEILAITGASTPIVKLFHLPTGFNCDLSFKNALGVQNSRLISALMQVNGGLLPCVVVLKYWARLHELTGPGRLSNYALTLMFVFYVQVSWGLLPSVESLQREPLCEVEVAGWNAGFSLPEQRTVDKPLHSLFGGFFEFYSEFDFDNLVICPLLGKPLPKAAFGARSELPEAFCRYTRRLEEEGLLPLKHARPVCIQDPFDLTHNIAAGISNNILKNIKDNIKFAANAYKEDRENDYSNFLRKILLEGVQRSKGRKSGEMMSVRYPAARRSMLLAEWREAMVCATTTVLGDMLSLALTEGPAKTHKTQLVLSWETALDKPIWRRKRFNHLYSKMKYDFIETQTRITREVMAVYREELFVRVGFQLRLKGPASSPRATLAVRYIDGDLDAFAELKAFFAQKLKGWLRKVLRIQLYIGDLPEVFAEGEALMALREERLANPSPPSCTDSSESGAESLCEPDDLAW